MSLQQRQKFFLAIFEKLPIILTLYEPFKWLVKKNDGIAVSQWGATLKWGSMKNYNGLHDKHRSLFFFKWDQLKAVCIVKWSDIWSPVNIPVFYMLILTRCDRFQH